MTTSQGMRYLFGGSRGWQSPSWHSVDDSVRGGSSTSSLIPPLSTGVSTQPSATTAPPALFRGNLNITTLGGAGFASVRASPSPPLDLTPYTTLVLSISHSDGKKYVLILKDTLDASSEPQDQSLPSPDTSTEDEASNRTDSGTRAGADLRQKRRRPDSQQDKSTPSYEAVFTPKKEGGEIRLLWKDFRRVYRGREQEGDGKQLDREAVVAMSLMMRSFFGEQEGDFELGIRSIGVLKEDLEGRTRENSTELPYRYRDDPDARDVMEEDVLEKDAALAPEVRRGWLGWLLSGCVKL